MPKKVVKNLLKNASFDSGAAAPDHWEWVVLSGRPVWRFDERDRFSGRRSVQIMQDVGKVHGEFRQSVPAQGSTRYRLQAHVRCFAEGTGENSGANLQLRALSARAEVGRLDYRPFFVGRHDWKLWSADYLTPPGADTLVVSFDMRNSDGAAWFDDISLLAVPAPLHSSASPQMSSAASWSPRRAQSLTRVESAAVFADSDVDFLARGVLEELLGRGAVDVSSLGRFKGAAADCVVLSKSAPKRSGSRPKVKFTLAQVEDLARERLVIMTPAALCAVLPDGAVKLERARDPLVAPCARIERESPVTRGFTVGDVVPWSTRDEKTGAFAQLHMVAEDGALESLGFETIATSVTASPGTTGRPVLLFRCGASGGGVLVMDLDLLNSRPSFLYEQNLTVLVLTNALGRPQTSLGAYLVPDFSYETFTRDIHELAAARLSVRVKEETKTASGTPIYSLEIGPPDAPAFFVDCGIHPYEWAPGYAAVMYMARLADEFDRGLPWAKALLSKRRLKCVPVYCPDALSALGRNVDGVNLNRNFPTYWDEYDGFDKGSAPLCAAETRAIAEILQNDNVTASVSFHETSADTNWVGFPSLDGRYARYAAAVPAVFRQLVDPGLFFWHAALWTQIPDLRNLHYHPMDSFPYLRDYGASRGPFQLHYTHSLGIDAALVEQYGNSDVSFAATPQRTELTGCIIEMLFGLQVGLVCRNHSAEAAAVSVPLVPCGASGEIVVYSVDGAEVSRKPLVERQDVAVVEAEIPPAGVLVVELDPFATA